MAKPIEDLMVHLTPKDIEDVELQYRQGVLSVALGLLPTLSNEELLESLTNLSRGDLERLEQLCWAARDSLEPQKPYWKEDE